VTAASARHKVTVAVLKHSYYLLLATHYLLLTAQVTVAMLKESLDLHFQIQMASSVSSFRTLIRTLAAKVSPAQLEQARYLVITPRPSSSSRCVT